MLGKGTSSYIDTVILRDRDANSGWASAADGTLEERIYYAQNWRADVSVVLSSGGLVKEWVKYSAYGVPYSITPGDFDADGFLTSNDSDEFDAAYNGGAGAWDARVDLNLDGSLTSADETIFTDEFNNGEAAGPGVLSRSMVASRVGYAGYQHARELTGAKWHVRHRVLDSETGRWTRRDPLEYVQSPNLYLYATISPLLVNDSSGLLPDRHLPPIDLTPPTFPDVPPVVPTPISRPALEDLLRILDEKLWIQIQTCVVSAEGSYEGCPIRFRDQPISCAECCESTQYFATMCLNLACDNPNADWIERYYCDRAFSDVEAGYGPCLQSCSAVK